MAQNSFVLIKTCCILDNAGKNLNDKKNSTELEMITNSHQVLDKFYHLIFQAEPLRLQNYYQKKCQAKPVSHQLCAFTKLSRKSKVMGNRQGTKRYLMLFTCYMGFNIYMASSTQSSGECCGMRYAKNY